MASNDSPTAIVLQQKIAFARKAQTAGTKYDLMITLFTLTSLQHSKTTCEIFILQ